jgi:hypothetical protein
MSTWRSRKRGSDTSLVPSNRFGIESSWRDLGKVHQSYLHCGSRPDRPMIGLAARSFRHFRSHCFLRAHFPNSLSFYSQAIQWPPNPCLMPSEVHLLLPDLDLGAFKPLSVRHASEASIKARRFLQLLPRKPATVPPCSHTINHRLSRRRILLWELEPSSYRHKVHPMLM